VLAPEASAQVSSCDRVVLRHGRELQLVVDGEPKTVWVTAASVDEALAQIGLRADSYVSASRSRSIPMHGLQLQIRTPKTVAILADGHVKALETTRPTVRDALMQAGVRLNPKDRLSAPRNAPLVDLMTIRVTRIVGRRILENVAIPYDTVRRPDATMYVGDVKVITPGRPGVIVRTFTLNYVNGKLKSKLMSNEVRMASPVTRVLAVGTKPRPAARRSSATGTGADGLNWPALARCESGGNPRAVSPNGMYRGLYQFSMGTWHGVGGAGDPIDASSAEQTYRAKILYNRSGRSPWPVCGKYL
jgi:resuscitation-promoting factor RpfB